MRITDKKQETAKKSVIYRWVNIILYFRNYTFWNNPLLKIQSFTVYLQMFFLKRKQALRLYLQKNIKSSPAYIRGFSWWQPASNAKFRGLVILEIWLGLIFFYQITLKYLFQCYQKKHLQVHGINPESCADIRFIKYTLWNGRTLFHEYFITII